MGNMSEPGILTAGWELLGVGGSALHGIEYVRVSLPGGTSESHFTLQVTHLLSNVKYLSRIGAI